MRAKQGGLFKQSGDAKTYALSKKPPKAKKPGGGLFRYCRVIAQDDCLNNLVKISKQKYRSFFQKRVYSINYYKYILCINIDSHVRVRGRVCLHYC